MNEKLSTNKIREIQGKFKLENINKRAKQLQEKEPIENKKIILEQPIRKAKKNVDNINVVLLSK